MRGAGSVPSQETNISYTTLCVLNKTKMKAIKNVYLHGQHINAIKVKKESEPYLHRVQASAIF